MSVPYDARCLECGGVHVIVIQDKHDEGDEIGYAHKQGGRDCSGFGDHELLARLDGLLSEGGR